MSRVRLMSLVLGMALAVPALAASSTADLAGTWRSAPEEISLTTAFDESVWGKNAKSVRTVEMSVRPTGEATLTVTRKVVDARGRTVKGSTSIEEAQLVLGAASPAVGERADLAVSVKAAVRRYPDDPDSRWPLDGLRVGVTTFADEPGTLEIRFDTPEGRGSFWETVRRGARQPSSTP